MLTKKKGCFSLAVINYVKLSLLIYKDFYVIIFDFSYLKLSNLENKTNYLFGD